MHKFYSCLMKFYFEKKYSFYVPYTSIFFLALSYLAWASFCYNNSFLYDTLFTRPEAFDGILEKGCLNSRKYPYISDSKNNRFIRFRKLTIKTSTRKSFLIHLQAFLGVFLVDYSNNSIENLSAPASVESVIKP